MTRNVLTRCQSLATPPRKNYILHKASTQACRTADSHCANRYSTTRADRNCRKSCQGNNTTLLGSIGCQKTTQLEATQRLGVALDLLQGLFSWYSTSASEGRLARQLVIAGGTVSPSVDVDAISRKCRKSPLAAMVLRKNVSQREKTLLTHGGASQ